MPHTRINDVDLYYEDGGESTPVVFVHGGFASLATTLENFEQWTWTWENDFVRHFHFIWYDRRGCYRSSCPDDGYQLEKQAYDLLCLLDHLHIPSAHVIGSSAGGPISMVFAALWPQRVRSLVLAGTGMDLFPQSEPVSDLIREQIAVLEQVGAEAAFEQRPAWVEVSFESFWVRPEAEARGWLTEYLEREQWLTQRVQSMPKVERVRYYAVELCCMQAYMQRDLHASAQQITCPTLVLHGTDDREVPIAWGEELAHTIPTAQLHVIAGGGHSLIHRSDEGRRVVIEFLLNSEP